MTTHGCPVYYPEPFAYKMNTLAFDATATATERTLSLVINLDYMLFESAAATAAHAYMRVCRALFGRRRVPSALGATAPHRLTVCARMCELLVASTRPLLAALVQRTGGP